MRLDKMTRAYLEAVLFTDRDDDDRPLDRTFSVSSFSEEDADRATAECSRFRELAGLLLDERGEERAGFDFWLTRNRHGCGFWDGNWPIGGERLAAICREHFSEVYAYVGDDGEIHFA